MIIFISLFVTVLCAASGVPRRTIATITEPSGRVIEEYNSAAMIGIDAHAREVFYAQSLLDRENDAFTPNRANNFFEITCLGNITLGSRVHAGYSSTVYVIIEYPHLLIKYQVHCSRLDEDIHPLIRDARYTNETSTHGLAPKIISLSPPALLCEHQVGKCAFTMSAGAYADCYESFGILRYMIMERVDGVSLHHFRVANHGKTNGAMPFVDAMIIGYHLIYEMGKMHLKAKILHGDIHSPNIMLKYNNATSGEFKLVFIDFGIASKIPEGPVSSIPNFHKGRLVHELRTQWQIDGYEWTVRDDVMKAIQTIAHLMHSFNYFTMEYNYRMYGYSELKEWKNHGDWFFPSSKMDPLAALEISKERKDEIRVRMSSLLKLARGMQLNQRPPYEEMLRLILDCIKIANESPTTTTCLPVTSTSST